nr:type II toxin-antitoxin system VapC family toxin [Thiocystis violacea]
MPPRAASVAAARQDTASTRALTRSPPRPRSPPPANLRSGGVPFNNRPKPRYLARWGGNPANCPGISLFEREEIFIPKTVLLEVEWVLRFSYERPRDVIAATLRKVLGLHAVQFEDPSALIHALEWYEHGLDFADALHLASSGAAERFATFDRKMAQRAKPLAAIDVFVI